MITDKDREDLIDDLRAYHDGWCLEEGKDRDRLIEFEREVRIESAEQARKEAAEIAVAFVDNNMIGLADCDIGLLTDLRAAIRGDSITNRIPDTREKLHPEITNDYVKKLEDDLAIAVKALEKINERHSFADIVDDSYIISRDALKEIQG